MAIPVRHQRQRFLAEHVAVKDLAILEIGAFDAPTWIGDNVPPGLRFLDWYSTEELFELHRGKSSRNWNRKIEVDYVVKHKRFSHQVSQRFELVVANHVIEHIADPIAWLGEVAAVTTEGGRLCLAIPDRRYTFDYIRSESTAVDLLRAHEADLIQPDYWQVLDSIYLYRPIRAEDCWPGPPSAEKLRERRFDLRTAMAHARRAEREYVDCHCFVFSTHTFAALIGELYEASLIPWRLIGSRGVQPDGNEFLVLLVKDG
jgi:SAM-dependent methyltransferase